MGSPTAEQVAQRAFHLGLLSDRQVQQVWSELGSRNTSLDELIQLLVRREFLTNYQVERLVRGEKTGFFFGDYRALYFVGSGSFARVFRAVHRETGQVVALKVLRRRYSESPSQFSQFIREGELGRALRHPNIVPIYEVYSRATLHFLVMEFVEGRNLREFVRIRGKLKALDALPLMIDIASGIDYAFRHGLTHRDLKMTNVLVSSRGQAKLVDFGLAAVDESVSENFGDAPNPRTVDYAALERATGVRKDDTRSDIYFLGCIYYHMLTGIPPLSETKDRMQRLSKQRLLDVVPIQKADPEVPDALGTIVNKAMMLEVDKRYQTPAHVLADLEAAARRLAGSPDGAAEPVSGAERERLAEVLDRTRKREAVMVVEANVKMQDIFREGLKRAGYRVLMTTDPRRALERLIQDPAAAACVIFNAQEVGQGAVEAFNRLADDPAIGALPAILLLDQSQLAWRKKAKSADHRAVLTMPLKMSQLLAVLARLIPAASPADATLDNAGA